MLDENLQPLGDRIIVEKPIVENKSKSGKIMLMEGVYRNTYTFGKVLAVGTGIYTQTGDLIPMSVKVGDEVLYKTDSVGDPLVIGDKEYLIFREHDLIMVKRNG